MALLQRNGSDFQQRTLMPGEAVDLQCRLLGSFGPAKLAF
jgi:hypothetical protein